MPGKDFGHRGLARIEYEADVVANAVAGWKAAGKEARVCRKGQWCGGRALLEQHPFAREAIDVRCGDALESVGTKMIGASRIERDQQDIEARSGHAWWQGSQIDPRPNTHRPECSQPGEWQSSDLKQPAVLSESHD